MARTRHSKPKRRRPISERTWAKVYKTEAHTKREGRCCYCRTPITLKQSTAEHKIPKKLGGTTSRENIDSACSPCNRAKGHRTRTEFMRAIHEPNFNTDPWGLYVACMQIRLRLRTEAACRRLRKILDPYKSSQG